MKAFALVLIVAAAAVGLFFLSKTNSDSTSGSNGETAGNPQVQRESIRPNRGEPVERASFLRNQTVSNLRGALATQDQALIEKAFAELVAFIQAHPELTDEYLEALRSELDEQLLRGLSKAMQQSEALMANDAFIKSIVEIAQQQGFEQRQHIMLDTLANAALIKPELFDAMKRISGADDQPTQVRASAVAVYADWMRKFPEKSSMLIDELGRALKETNDENVRALSVQLLALHRDKLSPDIQRALVERLKVEPQPAGRNLIATALSAASPEIRNNVLGYLRDQYSSQTDATQQRLTLAQMVMLSPMEMRPMLEQIAKGTSDIAEDAREYLVLVNTQQVTPEMIMNSIIILADNDPGHEHTESCKH